jgi:predicted transcriptional regulator
MLASELSVLLGNEVHPFLARLLAKGYLTRLKQCEGHIYFSSTPRIREAQEKSLLDKKCAVAAQLSLEKAVALLIEKIKNPELEADELAALLRSRGIALREQEVYGFLSLHGLAKKN